MDSPHLPDDGRRVLEEIVGRLGGAREFEPQALDPIAQLPGRTPGVNIAARAVNAAGADAILLDIGTSRMPGYSHVVWVSRAAESMIGSHMCDRLGEIVGGIDGVTGYAWEGLDRLHLRAEGLEWNGLLADARAALRAELG